MKLPRSIRVIERGWLSANNVVLHEESEAVVVDSGYVAHAPQTLALLERALAGKKLARLVNTHCHSDHMGGNAAIQKKFGCTISIPQGEAPAIDNWDEQQLILTVADQRAQAFSYDDTFRDGDVLQMGGLDWQVIAAPGHDTHAVMFYSPEARVLISGDALWENGFGVVFPQLFGRDTALAETRATLESIGRLDVDLVIPGHGRISDHADVTYYRDMITIIRDRMVDMIKNGMTLAQVKAARPTRDYDLRYGKTTGAWTTDMFVEAAYNSLKKSS